MKKGSGLMVSVWSAVGMLFLILDAKTALAGAQEGMELCIRTVIPSLLPFFVLSILMTSGISGRVFSPLCRLLKIPDGAGTLLIGSFLGGYPVGAQSISQAYRAGRLSAAAARRMLAFGNNCGPAFLFGIAAGLFDQPWIGWALWGIHIAGAVCVSFLVPAVDERQVAAQNNTPMTVVQALNQALNIMAQVSGWVILFRVVITVLRRWVLWMLPETAQIAVFGILELSNGCMALSGIENSGLRFILCSGFLSFGGLCVAMQTMSVTDARLDRSLYFPGKVVQTAFSLIMAYSLQTLTFPADQRWNAMPILCAGVLMTELFFTLVLRKGQKSSSIPRPLRV